MALARSSRENRAVCYVGRCDDKSPKKEALGMFRPLKNQSRMGSRGHFRLERPYLGPESHARWQANRDVDVRR